MTLNAIPTHPDANSYVTKDQADALVGNRKNNQGWSELTADQKTDLLIIATSQIDSFRMHHGPMYDNARDYRAAQGLKFPNCEAHNRFASVITAGANFITANDLKDRSDLPDDFWNEGVIIITAGTGRGQIRQISDFEMATGKVTVSEAWTTQPDTTSRVRVVYKVPADIRMAVVEQALFLASGGGERSQLQAEGVQSYSIGDLSETFAQGAAGSSNMPISVQAKAYLKKYISRIGRFV